MNHVYKKVWSRVRCCFVAVSEAMTSACQNAGKAMLISSALAPFFISSSVNALEVLSGEVGTNQIRSQNKYGAVYDNVTVNGNLTHSASQGPQYLYIGCTNRSQETFPDITLTVNGNLTVANDGWMALGHNNQGSTPAKGTLIVNGNMNVYGTVNVGDRSTYHNSSSEAHVTVTDTLTIGSGGIFQNNSDGIYGSINLNSEMNIANIRNSGIFRMFGGQSVVGNFGNLSQEAGTFQQTANNTYHFTGTVRLNGGSLNTADSIVIGQRIGKFSIGDSLILSGGTLVNRALITQKAGNFVVEKGNYSIETINKENGTLSNAGTLSITNFNQSNGTTANSGNLTIGHANLYGFLSNTGTLTLTGNVTSRGNLTSTGILNNRGNWTETAHYAISGSLNNSGAVNFQNGFEFASNGRLNSTGTLQTNNAANIFDSLGRQGQTALSTVSLQAVLPEETKTALTDLFRHYVPGSVAQSLIDHASFTGGKVIVTGVNLTTTQRDDLVQAFKAKFGSAATLEFQGTIAGVSHDDKLNTQKVNELYDNVASLRDVTILSHNLEGEGKAVEIGENGVKHSAGFKGINEAASISVKDGKTLELVGEKGENTNFVMTAVNTVVDGLS